MQAIEFLVQNKFNKADFPYRKSAFIVGKMRKKKYILSIISCVLICVIMFSLSACDSKDSGLIIQNEVVVAAAEKSYSYHAAVDYCEENGYKYNLYDNIYDASVAVVNGKADYIVVSEYEFGKNSFMENSLEFYEKASFSTKYYGVVEKTNISLCKEINNALKTLGENGTLEKAKRNYINNGILPQVNLTDDYKGELKVLYSPVFDNRLSYNDDGDLVGTDVAILRTLCNYLGYEVKLIECEFDEMFFKLHNGEGDIIFSSVEYTPQRAELYLYTDSYDSDIFNVYKRK